MCGIAGIISPKTTQKETVIGKMVDRITHRGPDDDGFYVDKNVGLGMRRLAIIDLKTGRQPISSDDGRLLIFFNGEIYNYKELRTFLEERGITFKTTSDTEVVLKMYELEGEKMLIKLRGMFGLCIYDTEDNKVFIARDFFGIKPIYYLTQNEKIVAFSSEIKSFLDFPDFKSEVNNSAVFNYLNFQFNPLTETFFKNVYKLPPAHFLLIDTNTGETTIKKYWDFRFEQDQNLSQVEAVTSVYNTVKDSVKHHMIADVPVGAFLSGGIDSSIIATLMQEIRGDKQIKTFTVGFDTLTEGKEAKETASFLGTDHTELRIGPDEYFSVLQKVSYHFDEPVADPSAVGLYFIAEEASKHVKVVLSGEGSDELFGGYNIYLTPFEYRKISFLPKFLLNFLTNLPFEYFGKNYLRRANMKLEDWYVGQKYFNGSVFTKTEIKRLWRGKEEKMINLSSLYKQTKGLSDSTTMQYIDIHTWLVGDILSKADKMTMANSLELRVPFLDMGVYEISRKLKDQYKWNNGVTKYILREAFKNIIPESTRNRRKLGFPTPIKDWLTRDKQEIYDLILENDYISNNLNTSYVKEIINDHINKKSENSRKIYTLLMLALWYNVFIKKQKSL